jgi:hypothetical protein
MSDQNQRIGHCITCNGRMKLRRHLPAGRPAAGGQTQLHFVANCIFDDKIHWAFFVASGYTLYGSAGASPSLAVALASVLLVRGNVRGDSPAAC